MIKSKKQMILVIVSFILVLVLGTISYAFFNYTRTGSTNNIRVGRINFESSQNNTINLSNVFPTDSSHLDNTNSSTVTIGITGDTNYEEGIEYKVSIDQVVNTVNNKEVPISFSVTASNLGTKSSDYYNDRGSTTNVYNLRETGIATNGEDIVIGYIKPDENGVNGSINITAYIDNDSVAISDTVSTIVNDNLVYGETPGDWIAGRTVLTTTEWNGLSTSGISFKVKVEANEGLWVPEEQQFVLKKLHSITEWKNVRADITSVEFHKDGVAPANPINTIDATDLTSAGPVTVYTVDDGLGNNTYKAIIVADDVIYAPEDSSLLFAQLSKLTTFNPQNFNFENAVNMSMTFMLCTSMTSLDGLEELDVSNVQNMLGLFYGCSNLSNINSLINWDTTNVQNMSQMFDSCSILTNVNALINWNTISVTDISRLFYNCKDLVNINGLRNWNVSNVTNMSQMFYRCEDLSNIDSLANWNTGSVTNMAVMFSSTLSLTDFSPLSNWNTSNVTDMYGLFLIGSNDGKKNGDPVIDVSFLAGWNTSKVVDMSYMFHNVSIVSYIPFKTWDVSKVENFQDMFNATPASPTTTLSGLENWNVSSATNMNGMFYDNFSLTDASAINDWNINANIDYTGMFFHTPVHPEFTRVVGTWSDGTFTPTP